VAFVLLELDGRVAGLRPRRNPGQPGDELGRLEADPHLVAIVLPGDRGPVDAGADLDAEDQPAFGDRPRLFGRMRMRVTRRKRTLTLDDCDRTRHSRGSTGSDSRASTAKTHWWTRQSGSSRATRSSASSPRAYSRRASERLCPRPRERSRSRLAGSV
jgi:hypothetical protein